MSASKYPAVDSRFQLAAVHDARHRLPADARESLVFMLQLPEARVAGFVYTWVSGAGKAGSAFVVYGPLVGEKPIVEMIDGLPVPESQGFDRWSVGKAEVRHGEAFKTAEVTVAGGGRASLEYRFEATHPPYAYGSSAKGCPGWVADNRIEQSGRITGALTVDGRRIPFDTMGHRDHSWGTRDWNVSQHWKWLEAQSGPDLIVHFWEVEALGRTILRGYVVRDGKMAEVTGVDVSFEHDNRLAANSFKAKVSDDLGRTTTVGGETFARFPFPVTPQVTLQECSMAITIDGAPGVGHVELCWPAAYLEYLGTKDISAGSPFIKGLK